MIKVKHHDRYRFIATGTSGTPSAVASVAREYCNA